MRDALVHLADAIFHKRHELPPRESAKAVQQDLPNATSDEGRLSQDERRRIAEELHDSTAQHLVAAGLGLTKLRGMIFTPEARDLLSEAMQSIRDATLEIRTLSYLLYPPQLGRVGLCAVLHEYVPGFESRTGVHTSLRLSSKIDRLPIANQHAILRVAQQSLCNVHRHARATNAWVTVRVTNSSVHVVIRDNGKGVDVAAGKELADRLRMGVGIGAMAARVGRPDDGKGTIVHVSIPLPEEQNATLH
jgi:signal transduction histidine kinase